MPRLILKCPYLKPGGEGSAHRGNYVRYMATRDGVDAIPPEQQLKPVTDKQAAFIEQLLQDYPDAENLFEYEDYKSASTKGNASVFITAALEHNAADMLHRDRYVSYIASRPRVEKLGSHGLFNSGDEPIPLAQVSKVVAEHPGNIWLPILSLRREDADRLGYNTAARWKTLLREQAPEIAKSMQIPPEDFRWVAAFHDEGHHPHVHMVCWSAGAKDGYLTKQGIRQFKSGLVSEIFRHDLLTLYKEQALYRQETSGASKAALEEQICQMQHGTLDNPRIAQLLVHLADRLRRHGGKKVYGYLRPPLKAMVDEIVDELAKDPRVADAYSHWYNLLEEVLRGYKDEMPPRLPLSRQKEFKPLRNMVVREAVRVMEGGFVIEQTPDSEDTPDQDNTRPDTLVDEDPPDVRDVELGGSESDDKTELFIEWNAEYKLAKLCLHGTEDVPQDMARAFALFYAEAQAGNILAMHDLGRMYAEGLGCAADANQSFHWHKEALSGFQTIHEPKLQRYVQYRVGKMHLYGLGTEQNYPQAAAWLGRSAAGDYKYAQYNLAKLYYDGNGVPQDFAQAFHLYEAAAEQDFPFASFEMGKMLRDGIGTAQDHDAAEIAFKDAFVGFCALEKQQPDDKLQYRIGWMLLNGVGTEQDELLARTYFEKAATVGNPHAQYQLARLMLKDPVLTLEELQVAIGWLTQSAENDNESAQYALGKLFQEDMRIKNIQAALHWLTKAAVQDHQYAQYRLGKLLLSNEKVPPDPQASIQWFIRSADQGNVYASFQLGKIYISSEWVEKDSQEALRWFTQSAGAGNQHAQYALGKLFLFGRDVPRDEEAAIHWLTLAAEQGNPYAVLLLQHREDWNRASEVLASTRLLNGLAKLFADKTPPILPVPRMGIDHKRLQALRQKGSHKNAGLTLDEPDPNTGR